MSQSERSTWSTPETRVGPSTGPGARRERERLTPSVRPAPLVARSHSWQYVSNLGITSARPTQLADHFYAGGVRLHRVPVDELQVKRLGDVNRLSIYGEPAQNRLDG